MGQPPLLVEQYDDKDYVNALLRSKGTFNMPKSWTIDASTSLKLSSLPYPIVGKPIRGRGSYGVKVCHTERELSSHLDKIFRESPVVMLEEFLAGQEGTVTVMPPSEENPKHWAMPIVVRYNHEDGIAPYNGIVAVTSNSRVISKEEFDQNSRYAEVSRQCEHVAELLRVTAPIRIDVRCYEDEPDAKFAIFDVNMKPVSLPRLIFYNVPLIAAEHDWTRSARSRKPSQPDCHVCSCTWLGLSAATQKDSGLCFDSERLTRHEAIKARKTFRAFSARSL